MRYFSGGCIFCVLSVHSILMRERPSCDGTMAKMGRISSVSGGFCDYCSHFLDVEGDGEEGKVHGDLVFAEVAEALVMHVVLHLPEHGLRPINYGNTPGGWPLSNPC